MKKNYNHRNLPASDGWRFNVSLHRHLGRLCALLLTLLAVNATAWADSYVKVTSTADITTGQYLIVCESSGVALDGSLDSDGLKGKNNNTPVTISNGEIQATQKLDGSYFTIDVVNKSLKSASGLYIGVSSYSNGLSPKNTNTYSHGFAIDNNGNALITLTQL